MRSTGLIQFSAFAVSLVTQAAPVFGQNEKQES